MTASTQQHSAADIGRRPAPRPPELWRIDTVVQRTGLSRSTVYALVKDGSFPRSVPLIGKTVAWDSREVEAWIEARIAAGRGGVQ
jgi:prophage regulatory protein